MTKAANAAALIRRRLFPPRRGGPYARYSRFVRIMKIVLPALAAVLLGLVLVWPQLKIDDTLFQLGFAQLPSKEVETLAMRNARYFGIDQSNRPYAVSADFAVQEPGQTETVRLTAPKADFVTTSGANVVIDAQSGLYHQSSHILDLWGGVNIYHDSGTELHTASASLDLSTSQAHGEEAVTGHGPQGTIDSTGFTIGNSGKDLTFTGRSRMTLRTSAAPPVTGAKHP